jgi:hypothetical protein
MNLPYRTLTEVKRPNCDGSAPSSELIPLEMLSSLVNLPISVGKGPFNRFDEKYLQFRA